MAADDVLSGSTPSIEFLMLAEYAETIHGKLYLMGGAWEAITVPNLAVPVAVTVAVSISVPWLATNTRHRLTVAVETGDGETLAEQAREVMVGRPTHIEAGASQRQVIVVPLAVVLPRPDRYAVVASIDEVPRARVSFRANHGHVHR